MLTIQSQNFLLYSQDFTQTVWNPINCSISGTITAPDGSSSGQALIATTTNSAVHSIYQIEPTNIGIGGAANFSVYIQAGIVSWALMIMDGSSAGVFFNLSGPGSIGSALTSVINTDNDMGSIRFVGGGWFLCSINVPARAHNSTFVSIYSANSNNSYIYSASDTSSAQIYLGGLNIVNLI